MILNHVPDQSSRQAGAVAFATELSIRLFFTDATARTADVQWTLRASGGATHLVGRNGGGRRRPIADLLLTGAGGATVSRAGLVDYVLEGRVDAVADRADGASGPVEDVRLDRIPGLGWRLIVQEQISRFIVPPDIAAAHELDATMAASDTQMSEGADPRRLGLWGGPER